MEVGGKVKLKKVLMAAVTVILVFLFCRACLQSPIVAHETYGIMEINSNLKHLVGGMICPAN